jgi:peptidoglycan/LPS O-acetylase OafA/YrhL
MRRIWEAVKREASPVGPGGRPMLAELTGIRALAVYMVFFHHFPPGDSVLGKFLNTLVKEFHIGVVFFFVLSGFILYLTYARSSTAGFYRNRAARIYPVYLLAVLGTGLTALLSAGQTTLGREAVNALLQLSFLRGFSNAYKFIGVGQAWALSVEALFYALFPLLLVRIRRHGFLRPLLAVYLAGFVLWRVGELVAYREILRPADFMLYYTFFGRAGEFFLGMWLAHRYLARDPSPIRGGLPWRTLAGLAGIALCVLALAHYRDLKGQALLSGITNTVGVHPTFFGMFITVNNVLLPVATGLLLYGLLVERSLLRSLLRAGPLVLLGKSSYIFFLIHTGFVAVLLRRLLHLAPPTGSALHNLYLFLIINVLSVILFFFVEEPCRKLLRARPA